MIGICAASLIIAGVNVLSPAIFSDTNAEKFPRCNLIIAVNPSRRKIAFPTTHAYLKYRRIKSSSISANFADLNVLYIRALIN